MNKFVEWILGHRATELDRENREATEDMRFSRMVREKAERVGTAQRKRIEQNHVGEGFRLAFEAGQRERGGHEPV